MEKYFVRDNASLWILRIVSYIECGHLNKIKNVLRYNKHVFGNYDNYIFLARRKPGPKPRRVVSSTTSSQLPPGAPSASLVQLFASADSPRPPSRAETPDSHSSSGQGQASSSSAVTSLLNHKDGRPRNLGRGVSKPKKNTVASLLAQSRALGEWLRWCRCYFYV